jgi:hypothetical protein
MPSSNLRDLVSDLPGVIEKLQTSITNIDGALVILGEQKSAIQNDVMGVMTSASDDWTAWKASSLGSMQVSSWGNYGTSNLTSWWIYNPASRPYNNTTNPSYVVYQSSDVTSAGPAQDNTEARQYDRQIEFPLSLDHIDDAVGVSPGTYGIDEKISALTDGKTLAQNNEAKYSQVLKIYDKYNNYPPTGT